MGFKFAQTPSNSPDFVQMQGQDPLEMHLKQFLVQKAHLCKTPGHIGHVLLEESTWTTSVHADERCLTTMTCFLATNELQIITIPKRLTIAHLFRQLDLAIECWTWMTSNFENRRLKQGESLRAGKVRLLRCETRHLAHWFICNCLDHVRTFNASGGISLVQAGQKVQVGQKVQAGQKVQNVQGFSGFQDLRIQWWQDI